MKNLLLSMFALALSVPTYAQLSCNASISASTSGTTVTLTNSSTPVATSTIYTHYNISWGDGSSIQYTSNNNPLNHVYTASGAYSIKLWSYVQDSLNNNHCNDSDMITVNINIPPPNVISGRVYFDSMNSGPTDSMMIWLITFDSGTNLLTAIDSQRRHVSSPFYNFTGKSAGLYRTKAALMNGVTSGVGNVPTYHDSSLLWNSAIVINHTGASSINKDIYMRTGTLTSGPGFVGGNVSAGANKGTANGIEGMNIFLLDANSQVVAYAVTDANGDYSFSSLPNATYTVHPEDINYTTTPASLTVTASQATHNGINFERSLSQKTIIPKPAGISNVNGKQLAFAVFPNPATDVVNINWNNHTEEAATITITDISGKKVYNTEVRMNANAVINIGGMQTGLYFLNVTTEFGVNTQKLIVQ